MNLTVARKMVLKLCYGFCIVLSVPLLSYAKDWRGIVPMRSTRADVERLLGEPTAPPKDGSRVYILNKFRSIYFGDEGEVYIDFAEAEIPAAVDCLTRIPAGTVLMIQVTPNKELSLRDLPIDENRFRKFDPSDPPEIGYAAYIDEQEGLIIRTFRSRVEEIVYIASAAAKAFCPSYYENPETFVRLFVCGSYSMKFDEFGDLSAKEERARLDNYAIQLENQTGSLGYIIAYAGSRTRAAEALTRAKRAKDYLERERNIDVGRVFAIDGGYREDFTIELFIGDVSAEPPKPTPTVPLSEVRIISDREKPRKRRRAQP